MSRPERRRAMLGLAACMALMVGGCPYPAEKTVTVEIRGADEAACEGVWLLLPTLVDAENGYSVSKWQNDVITVAPVASSQEFARRLRAAFAKNTRVEGRTIFVQVDEERLKARVLGIRIREFLEKLPVYVLEWRSGLLPGGRASLNGKCSSSALKAGRQRGGPASCYTSPL